MEESRKAWPHIEFFRRRPRRFSRGHGEQLLDAGLASREQRSGEELAAFGEAVAVGL